MASEAAAVRDVTAERDHECGERAGVRAEPIRGKLPV